MLEINVLYWKELNLGIFCVWRFSYISWLASLNVLSTLERLEKWGIITKRECCFYNMADESLDHLYFECSITNGLWKVLQAIYNVTLDDNSGKYY